MEDQRNGRSFSPLLEPVAKCGVRGSGVAETAMSQHSERQPLKLVEYWKEETKLAGPHSSYSLLLVRPERWPSASDARLGARTAIGRQPENSLYSPRDGEGGGKGHSSKIKKIGIKGAFSGSKHIKYLSKSTASGSGVDGVDRDAAKGDLGHGRGTNGRGNPSSCITFSNK